MQLNKLHRQFFFTSILSFLLITTSGSCKDFKTAMANWMGCWKSALAISLAKGSSRRRRISADASSVLIKGQGTTCKLKPIINSWLINTRIHRIWAAVKLYNYSLISGFNLSHNCLSCVFNSDDQSWLHIFLRSSNIWSFINSFAFTIRANYYSTNSW